MRKTQLIHAEADLRFPLQKYNKIRNTATDWKIFPGIRERPIGEMLFSTISLLQSPPAYAACRKFIFYEENLQGKAIFLQKISTTMKILFIIGVFLYVLSECGNSLFDKGGKSGKF